MMRRLRHQLFGHRWMVASAVFNGGSNQYRGTAADSEDEKLTCWGFTQILFRCDCGTFKHMRLVGNHSALQKSSELAELERLAKLQ